MIVVSKFTTIFHSSKQLTKEEIEAMARKYALDNTICYSDGEYDRIPLYEAFLAGYTAANQWVPVGERLPDNQILEQGEKALKVTVFHTTFGIMHNVDFCFKKFTITSNYVDPWGMGSYTNLTPYTTHWMIIEPPTN